MAVSMASDATGARLGKIGNSLESNPPDAAGQYAECWVRYPIPSRFELTGPVCSPNPRSHYYSPRCLLLRGHDASSAGREYCDPAYQIEGGGSVYEFNNAKGHAVRNLGPSRVHLIIDWVEEPIYNEEKYQKKVPQQELVQLRPREVCTHPRGVSDLVCDGGFQMNEEKSDHHEEEQEEKDEL